MKHCVFCSGTGVHQCPGGTLESGYWARRERLEGTASTSFTLGGEPASDYSPGLVNADDYYALPEFDPCCACSVLVEHLACPCFCHRRATKVELPAGATFAEVLPAHVERAALLAGITAHIENASEETLLGDSYMPAWDQSDGVWCEEHQEDATLCPCSDQPEGDA